jgi:hypothetical protein
VCYSCDNGFYVVSLGVRAVPASCSHAKVRSVCLLPQVRSVCLLTAAAGDGTQCMPLAWFAVYASWLLLLVMHPVKPRVM